MLCILLSGRYLAIPFSLKRRYDDANLIRTYDMGFAYNSRLYKIPVGSEWFFIRLLLVNIERCNFAGFAKCLAGDTTIRQQAASPAGLDISQGIPSFHTSFRWNVWFLGYGTRFLLLFYL